MFENESKFPDPKEYVCPPEDAKDAEGMTLYKFNNKKKIPSKYMEPMIIKGKSEPKNNKERCRMCGHSVFLSYGFAKDLQDKSKFAKASNLKWKYVYKIKGGKNSKILSTPSERFKNHHTYWHFGGKLTAKDYEYVCDLTSDETMEG